MKRTSDSGIVLWLSMSCAQSQRALVMVASATTVARFLYVVLTMWGKPTADDCVRLERSLARMRRTGFLPSDSRSLGHWWARTEDSILRSVIRSESHVPLQSVHAHHKADLWSTSETA